MRWTSGALALIALSAAVACGGEPEEAAEPIIRPVRYIVVGGGESSRSRRFSGVVEAGEQARLSFRVAGTVQQRAVNVGDRVEEGQLIAALDPTDYQIQLSEAQAATAQAAAQRRNANAEYARVRALYENQNASRQELDAARTQSETSGTAVRSAGQRAQLARRQIDYCNLTAPAMGSVASVDVEENENVQPGQVVAVLQSGDDLKIRVTVPDRVIHHAERGQTVDVSLTSLDGRTVTGTVFEVGVASGGTSTFPVTVRLAEQVAELRAGMPADVDFQWEVAEADAAMRVPSVAVGEDRDGRYVYVVERGEDGLGTVHRRAVEIGDLDSEGVAVTSGLEEGELVVTAGLSRIRDGLEVRVPDLPDAPSTEDDEAGPTDREQPAETADDAP